MRWFADWLTSSYLAVLALQSGCERRLLISRSSNDAYILVCDLNLRFQTVDEEVDKVRSNGQKRNGD